MRLNVLLWSGLIFASMALASTPPPEITVRSCPLGQVNAASYTHNFKAEANSIFEYVQADARQMLNTADQLRSLEVDPEVSRETHAEKLDTIRDDVNDIEARLCRLEAIRRVLSPWQQHVVDRIAKTARFMVDNEVDAINICNDNPHEINFPVYWLYTRNLYNESRTLTRSLDEAVQYSGVSKEYRDLRGELGTRRSS